MNIVASIPTVDQFENPSLIQHHRLLVEPPSFGSFSSKLLTTENLLHVSKHREIGNCHVRAVWTALQNVPFLSLQCFTFLGEAHADEHYRAAVNCVDLSHCACHELHVAVQSALDSRLQNLGFTHGS